MRSRRAGKRVLLACCAPIVLLVLPELLLRVTGVSRPQPLFVVTDRGELAPNPEYGLSLPTFLAAGPPPDARMARTKPGGVLRVFVIGESTVAGFGLYPYSHIARWLEVRLRELLPEQPFEVINLGIPGIDSAGLRYVVHDALDYQPDLIVLYAGHNEFLEPNLFRIRQPATWFFRTLTRDSYLMSAMRRLLFPAQHVSVPPPQPSGNGPVFDLALITTAERGRLLGDYEANLAAMVSESRARGVRVLLCTPGSDPRFPPMFAHYSRTLAPAQKQAVRDACLQARAALEQGTASAAAIASARAAIDAAAEIDPAVSLVAYFDGKLAEVSHDPSRARAAFVLARDLDGRPHRASSAIVAIVQRIAHRFQLPLVETAQRLDDLAFEHAADDEGVFIDHCHPGVRAQWLIAGLIAQAMARAGWPAPEAKWRFAAEPSVAVYLERNPVPEARVAEIQFKQAMAHLRKWLRATTTGEELEVGRAAAALAVRLQPRRAAYHGLLGVLEMLSGRREPAQEHLDLYLRDGPDSLTEIAQLIERSPELRPIFGRAGLQVAHGRFELLPAN
ncbi:MAG: SGNH/GDSL hydrolase family protein [Planctomycetota bacterium]